MITIPFMLATGMITPDIKINKDFKASSISPELKQALIKNTEATQKLLECMEITPYAITRAFDWLGRTHKEKHYSRQSYIGSFNKK